MFSMKMASQTQGGTYHTSRNTAHASGTHYATHSTQNPRVSPGAGKMNELNRKSPIPGQGSESGLKNSTVKRSGQTQQILENNLMSGANLKPKASSPNSYANI